MEHVNILTQEPIMQALAWPPVVIGIIGVLITLFSMFYFALYKKDPDKTMKGYKVALLTLPLMLLATWICDSFFPVETGRYKYSGTLDDNMTIVEYKKFQDTYINIRYVDDIWYWEDKE